MAANNNNIGGNPALSYMSDKEYGQEINHLGNTFAPEDGIFMDILLKQYLVQVLKKH